MKIEVEDLKKINMLPGDTLVIRYKERTPPMALRSLSKGFYKQYPNNKLMIIPSTIEIYKLISEKEEVKNECE